MLASVSKGHMDAMEAKSGKQAELVDSVFIEQWAKTPEQGLRSQMAKNQSELGVSSLTQTGTLSGKVKPPHNLPKFRGKSGIQDPEEFLGEFSVVCRTHSVPLSYYVLFLEGCLDLTDRNWYEGVKHQSWSEVEGAFKAHFIHPHTAVQLKGQLQRLKMTGGVQRYADEFMGIINRLGLDEQDSWATFHFKQGLSAEVSCHLVAVEAFHGPLPLQKLISAALNIEANQEILSKGVCYRCKRPGHKISDCPLKEKDSPPQRPQGGKGQVNDDKKKDDRKAGGITSTTPAPICYTCGIVGHKSNECPQKGKMVPVGKPKTNKPTNTTFQKA